MNLSAYEVFYDEKRPFFLEGKHILEFDNNDGGMMFYSRRIGAMSSSAATPTFIPIIHALKLTGTNRKGLTVGLLESVTAQTSAKVMLNGVRGREVTEPLDRKSPHLNSSPSCP